MCCVCSGHTLLWGIFTKKAWLSTGQPWDKVVEIWLDLHVLGKPWTCLIKSILYPRPCFSSLLSVVAMVRVPDPEMPKKPCPVLTAWAQLDDVLQRVATCGLMTYTSGRLTRQTCVGNGELLLPVISKYGPLPAFKNEPCECVNGEKVSVAW